MPTYAYACSSCGHSFDMYQAFTDDPLTVCPECNGALRKQFGNVGVVFKGSGFYRNDARGKSGAATSTEASSTEKKSTEKKSTETTAGSSSSSAASNSTSSSSSASAKKSAAPSS